MSIDRHTVDTSTQASGCAILIGTGRAEPPLDGRRRRRSARGRLEHLRGHQEALAAEPAPSTSGYRVRFIEPPIEQTTLRSQ